jgi:23S rRNA pseudouridine1911/1915/1917 synthase
LDIYAVCIHSERNISVKDLILYRDASLIVCEKPVGVSSESPGLPELLGEQAGAKVWPVHRLDRDTGGVMVFALSAAGCASLQRLFQGSEVSKEYLAVVCGCPGESSGCWQDLLWHDKTRNKTYVVRRMRKGVKEALCEWETVSSVTHDGQPFTLVRVRLHTGRTHQIRVQFASRGIPLAGDRKYGASVRADTPALWASGISFPHPDRKSGAVTVRAAPPAVFPWNLFSL